MTLKATMSINDLGRADRAVSRSLAWKSRVDSKRRPGTYGSFAVMASAFVCLTKSQDDFTNDNHRVDYK